MKDLKDINILDYICTGHENAKTGLEIANMIGINERDVRELISAARYKAVIINLQDGYGYFKPDVDEDALVVDWLNQEESRLKNHAASLHAARQWRKGKEVAGKKLLKDKGLI